MDEIFKPLIKPGQGAGKIRPALMVAVSSYVIFA
jgi:hypothetical protein